MANYIVRELSHVQSVPCPCGASARLLTRQDTPLANFHVTHIKDARKHYHQDCSEIYYVLEGTGVMELGEDRVAVSQGMMIFIPAGLPHAGKGDFKTVIVGIPAIDYTDEHFPKVDS